MAEQTIFSLSEAAKITGKSKATIHRALNDGRLSATSKEDGQYQIDAAELFRVFPETAENVVLNGSAKRSGTPTETTEEPARNIETDLLRQQLAKFEAMHEQERRFLSDQIEELRRDRDRWAQQAERLALAYQPKQDAEAPAEPVRRGFRIFGLEIRRSGSSAS